MDNRKQERRESVSLSDEQLQEIADRAVDAAFKRVQMEIGRTIISRMMFFGGCLVVAIMYYVHAKGLL